MYKWNEMNQGYIKLKYKNVTFYGRNKLNLGNQWMSWISFHLNIYDKNCTNGKIHELTRINWTFKIYLKRWVPLYCFGEDCHYYLGGSYAPKEKSLDAQLLTSSLASVRKNVAGVPIRILVNLQENKVILISEIHIWLDDKSSMKIIQ